MLEEQWKIVSDNTNYVVSNTGKVKRIDRNKILKPYYNPRLSAHVVVLSDHSKLKTYCLEKLVLRAFNPLADELIRPRMYSIDHIDGDVNNNNADNLRFTIRVYPKGYALERHPI